jgi:4-diphosphocytidyl-2-C-methyl-D-erythritol kinase
VNRRSASAKLNLALVVGPLRDDGKHAVATVLQRIDVTDRIELEQGDALHVEGFNEDTLVRRALELVAEAAGVEPRWRATIEKRIPVASGLGGGSSDAAVALRLANDSLGAPLDDDGLHELAVRLGSDVPFFLREGPHLATGDGTDLEALDLPQDFWVVLVLPREARKKSTAAVYAGFDDRGGGEGFAERRDELFDALERVTRPSDLARLPANDLASSPHAAELRSRGAFRADVSGAGPMVYGLFTRAREAEAAASALEPAGRIWLTVPAWYG